MNFTAISDTHLQHRKIDHKIPNADFLFHTGDNHCTSDERSRDFLDWLQERKDSGKHKHIVIIAGNHDWTCLRKPEWFRAECKKRGIVYLHDETVEIQGITIFGSPTTPMYGDWAFMLHRGKPLEDHWKKIPDKVDIVLTHGPKLGILDENQYRENCGDLQLLERLENVNHKYHVQGHIHHSAGYFMGDKTITINAAVLDDYYDINNVEIKVWEI